MHISLIVKNFICRNYVVNDAGVKNSCIVLQKKSWHLTDVKSLRLVLGLQAPTEPDGVSIVLAFTW